MPLTNQEKQESTHCKLHCNYIVLTPEEPDSKKKQNQGKHNQSINSNCMVHKKKWQTHMYKKKIKQWR